MYEYEYRFLIHLFIAEFTIFCGIWMLFIFKRFSFFYIDRVCKNDQEAINEYLTAIVAQEIVAVPRQITKKQTFLMQLELFDKNFSHDEWNKIKKRLLKKYLFPCAEKYIHSFFWRKRLFAVRCFALAPSKVYEDQLIALVRDKKIMIRIYAVKALIHLQSKHGIEVVLEEISEICRYCHYLYQDFFQDSSLEVIDIIIKSAKNPKLFPSCLKILAPLVVTKPIPFFKKALTSDKIEERLLAVELLSHNPTEDAEDILIEILSDENEQVQKQAIKGLGWIATKKGIVKLREIFHSSKRPKVILEAARALHALGKLKQENELEYTSYVHRFG